MRFADAQLLTLFARLLKDHASIVSGAYRFRRWQQASGWDKEHHRFEWRDLTDDEKLEQALSTMGRRIDFMQEIEDRIAQQESDIRQQRIHTPEGAPICPVEECDQRMRPWPKTGWHDPPAWHCPIHGGPVRVGGASAQDEDDPHCLIYGRIPEPVGCCAWSARRDVLSENPGAKFKPVDPADCPVCKEESE
jgi:hypothetical protein